MDNPIERFAAQIDLSSGSVLEDVEGYAAWAESRRGVAFHPSAEDDVELRTYLLHLRHQGLNDTRLREILASLNRFYRWAAQVHLIDQNPFTRFDFRLAGLPKEQIRRRSDRPMALPLEAEVVRLRCLNTVAEILSVSSEVPSLLSGTLEAVVQAMGLSTAWASLYRGSGLLEERGKGDSSSAFELGAAYGLPPGLAQDDSHFLRQPSECHCQRLLRTGRLARAVNVVECSRLKDAALAGGDNRGLLFHASVPLIFQGRPLGIINVATEDWQLLTAADLHLLSAVGAQVSVALERARLYQQALAHEARMVHELEMARDVQATLIPRHIPELPGFSLVADWRAARQVAGDFYDVFPLAGGRWGIAIADVSDKGAPAALYMAMVRSLLRSKSDQAEDPASVLAEVNRDLLVQSSADMFVTVFYAVLDPSTRTLTYTNAGHPPPLLRSPANQVISLARGGRPLGMFDEIPLVNESLRFAPREILVAYTDGVTEALNPGGRDYGTARLLKTVASGPQDAAGLMAHLLADHGGFIGEAAPSDDITLLILGCSP